MSDEIYQTAILDRVKSPSHAGRLSSPDVTLTIDNPLCGDRVTLDLKVADGKIANLSHVVRGCALCQASASVMADAVIGRTAADVAAGKETIKTMLGGSETPAGPWSGYGIFAPVRAHKSRHDCVLLPLEALTRALAQRA